MIVTAEMVLGVIDVSPSSLFGRIPQHVRQNEEIKKAARERAASVAYMKQLEEYYPFVGMLISGLPGYDDLALQEAAKALEVSEANLKDWALTIEGWDRSEWFFILFLDCALDAGLFPAAGDPQ